MPAIPLDDPTVEWFAGMGWVVGAAFLVAFANLLLPGWRQARRVVAPARIVAVAAGLAALVTVPMLPLLVLDWTFARGLARTVVHDQAGRSHVLADPLDGRPDLLIVIAVWLCLLRIAVDCLRLPRQLRHLERLPPPEPALAARVAELAARLRVRPPQVVFLPGLGADQEVQGMMAGVLAPVMVVTDGVWHRLGAAERDAVLAHELGHVRQRSLQKVLLAWTAVGTAGVLASGSVPMVVMMLWLFAMLPFTRTLIGWRDELAADRAAGRCVGHAVAAAALDQTHGARGLLGMGRAGAWLHAFAVHPGMSERAARLAEDAPPEVRARIAVDTAEVRRGRRVRWVVLSVWAALLCAVLVLGARGWTKTAYGLAAVVTFVPVVPYLWFVRRIVERFRLGVSIRWQPFAVTMASLLLAMLTMVGVGQRWFSPWALLVLPVLLATGLLAGTRERRAQRELGLLLQQRHHAEFGRRLARAPRGLRRNAGWQLWQALARAAAGERTQAAEDLLLLHARQPRFRLAKLWAATLLRADDPARSVALLRELRATLPASPTIAGALAAGLLRQGAVDEAGRVLQDTLAGEPQSGFGHALAARCEVARGDLGAAAEALARAERLAPNDPKTLVARAELQLAQGDAAASETLAKLEELAQQLPFAFVEDDIACLQDRRRRGALAPG